MNWKDKNIEILNLTNTEINILNVLTTFKSVQNIAIESKISRTGINYIIKGLVDKGLINYKKLGKRYLYIAISKEEIILKLQECLDQIKIQNTDKKGVKIKTSMEDEFIIHIGIKEIIPAYKRIAFENKNERVRAIQHHRSWSELINKISQKQLIEFNQAIIQNKIV